MKQPYSIPISDEAMEILKRKAAENKHSIEWMLNKMIMSFSPSGPKELKFQAELRQKTFDNFMYHNPKASKRSVWDRAYRIGWYAFQLRKGESFCEAIALRLSEKTVKITKRMQREIVKDIWGSTYRRRDK